MLQGSKESSLKNQSFATCRYFKSPQSLALTGFEQMAKLPRLFFTGLHTTHLLLRKAQELTPERAKLEAARPWLKREGYSIVRCLPVTGRTHQLRVHLQFLGHPIANDPIYCNQRVWGASLGANDADASQDTDEDIITRLSRMGKSEVADAVAYHDEMVDEYNKKKAEKMSGKLCEVCSTPLYTDPGEQELSLWLHSLRYEDASGAWKYVSPLPAWALPPEGTDGATEVGGMETLVEAAKEENPEIA
jgi:tRNA pseudouridine synthase 9